jgi:ribosomal protein S18 acetylase RimI-like enzyme
VLIRPASEADAAAVTALWTEAYSGRHPEGRQLPYEESEFFAALDAGGVWVAVDPANAGEAVLGVVALQPPGSPAKTIAIDGEAEFGRLAVSVASRGRGTGRALVEHTIVSAREWGAGAIALWSRPYQSEAHRIYESLGFRRARGRDSRDARGPRHIFVRELGDAPRKL